MNNIIPFANRRREIERGTPARLTVFVIFTTVEATLGAARAAQGLAKPMGAEVVVLHLRPVPYAVPLDSPIGTSPSGAAEFAGRLRADGISVDIRVCLCRSERDAAIALIPSASLVVVGRQRAWWPTRASRWRRMLERLGHRVVLVHASRPPSTCQPVGRPEGRINEERARA